LGGSFWKTGAIYFVLAEEFESALGELGSGVEFGVLFNLGDGLIVEVVSGGIEEAALVIEDVGSVKSFRYGHSVESPHDEDTREFGLMLRGVGDPQS